MKKLYTLLLFVCFSGLASASHLMGSDMFYKSLGNGKYEITIRVYRDCNGIQIAQSNIIARCSTNTVTISQQTKVSVKDVTGIGANCPVQSRCAGNFQFGVEEHTWKATVDLSSYSCCEWVLSWSQSARNGSITTGAANQNFFTTAMLNKCVNNSSPTYENLPFRFVCRNQDVTYNLSIQDTIDAYDSFSFALVNGLQSTNTSVTYSGSFSPTRPISFLGFPNENTAYPGGFHFDPSNGDLSFRATKPAEVGIIVIEVTEWRNLNGTMQVIGKTRRDMQLIVIECPQNPQPPSLSVPLSYEVCAGDSISIPFYTIDIDSTDTTYIDGIHSLPGANFTQNNGQSQHATGYFHWRTDTSMIAKSPFYITLHVWDNACPLSMEKTRTITIYVTDSTTTAAFYAGPDRLLGSEDSIVLLGLDTFNVGQTAYWRSLGDGTFSDSLSAISVYYPGPNDRLQCSIPIIRQPITQSYCGSNAGDTMIIHVNNGWMTVVPDSMNIPNADSMVVNTLHNLDSVYQFQWTSSGDGYFNPSNGTQTSYVFGSQDSLNCGAWLYLTASSNVACRIYLDSIFAKPQNMDTLKIHYSMSVGTSDTVFLFHNLQNSTPITWWGGGGTWIVDSTNFSAFYLPSAFEKNNGNIRLRAEAWQLCEWMKDSVDILLSGNGIRTHQTIPGLKLYPNPSSARVHIHCEGEMEGVQIQVYDGQGRKVLVPATLAEDLILDIQDLSPGVYWIHIRTAAGQSQSISFIRSK